MRTTVKQQRPPGSFPGAATVTTVVVDRATMETPILPEVAVSAMKRKRAVVVAVAAAVVVVGEAAAAMLQRATPIGNDVTVTSNRHHTNVDKANCRQD